MPDTNVVQSRADELNAAGAKHHHEGRIDAARLHYLAALFNDPEHQLALQNLGAALVHMEKFEAAASVSRRALMIAPNEPHIKGNLAVALLDLRRYGEAQRLFSEVLKVLPDAAPVWHNYGLALYQTGDLVEALAAFDKSLLLDPENIQVKSDRGLTLLALGRIQQGLETYEVRWKLLTKSRVWKLDVPEWQGEELRGQRLLVHHEQGFGDSLMLCRFVRHLISKGAIVTYAVPEELVRLMTVSFRPTVKVVDWESELSPLDFDFHTPLMSAMRWLKIERPDQVAWPRYLRAEPKIEAEALPKLPKAKLRVGICWASGDHNPALNRRRRIVPLLQFLPMTELPNVKLISLQKGDDERAIVDIGAEGIIFDSMARVSDFADTAALISELDVVISVDSAVVHLAAAMGKLTIMLSPFTRCWRWWGGDRGWPWYSDMRILFQSGDGSWNSAMSKATDVITTLSEG